MAADNNIVVFRDSRFPTADSAPAPDSLLEDAVPGARFASANELTDALNSANLLVLPYGSAFPEAAWGEIQSFLQRGGNLLVLGGRPFSRAAYRDAGSWKLREYSVRYMRPLRIDQYQDTPGSDGLKFESNPDIPLSLPQFAWKQGFSPIIHLSAVDLYERGGSAGSIDSNLDALAWATQRGRRMSAPVIQIDHFRNGFDGGRWIFVNAELSSDFWSSANAREIISQLAGQAQRGADEFTVRPVLPLYLPGEPIELQVTWNSARQSKAEAFITISSENDVLDYKSSPVALPVGHPLIVPSPKEKGLHVVTALLQVDGKPLRTYNSAFWVRDLDYLRSGPKLGVNENYFELDDKPLAVIGTTYMSSEVQRLYFDHPNVYVWDQDLRQIHDAGLNMIRTGWWTGWDKFCDENGVPYERTLRTLEAYLMTARKYGLPVQFNFFAFLPEVLGGVNPYLDPEAVRKQKTLISAVVARFHDVPFLAYDLINEPSFSKHLWTMRPNGDWIETQKWNDWLNKQYPNREALAAAWNVPITSVQGQIPLPEDIDFQPRGMYSGRNSLKIYDYEMFAQESFVAWVKTMRDAIRETGSQQLITVGQDEGGFQDRPSPAFFGQYVDFTTNHSWWQNDSILWDSLVAKQPGKAMLIQETGLQRELNLDETSRRTPENEAALFERKVAMSFVHGSGAIEWLWNTNSYMTEGNETPIGALRADGTEKPEATVMRNFAKFAAELSPHLRNPEPAQVAIIASQAAQYSAIGDLQIEAQRKTARALAYYAHLTPYLIYENQIDKIGSPKLAILPSAQALTETAWQQLLKYVDNGGNLLITGPVDRDEHWQRINRAAALIPGAQSIPLTYHVSDIRNADATKRSGASQASLLVNFDEEAQSWLESLRIDHGMKEIAHGKGKIFWIGEPIELSADENILHSTYPTGSFGIQPEFGPEIPAEQIGYPNFRPGVMAYPISLEDSVLYIFVSDAAEDSYVNVHDRATGVTLNFSLPAEHAALALIGKKQRAVIAKYGF
ncbi:MAG TPA: beta-galactosidase [Terriglobales bacterium]|nr:beta-galactosidase [Terriglobales bacterium]